MKPLAWIAMASLCLATRISLAGGIEADPSKKYELSKNRGPWMIMVATFHTTDDDGKSDEGKSPEQAAHELVLELRQLGLPAYIHNHKSGQERVIVTDRANREERRKNLRRYSATYVVAGNYNDINDKIAQDSLGWVKNLHPKCLQDGVVYEPTPGRPGPLSGAFLTVNPLLNGDEVKLRQRVDPLLVRLNSGERFSLLENKGQYTLVVARFYGKSMTVKNNDEGASMANFLKKVSLDDAGLNARELVSALRGNFDKEATQFNNVDAYIWHDRHESVVTVGSFSSANDPEIERYRKRFGPKLKDSAVKPEHLALSGFGAKGDEARIWVFEPEPAVIPIPRVK